MSRAPLTAGLLVLVATLGSVTASWAAPPEPAADAAQVHRELDALAAAADREASLRTVLCLRRHGKALGSALVAWLGRKDVDPRAIARVAPHVPDLGLEPRAAVDALETILARGDLPDLLVLAPLSAVAPAPSPPLADLLRRALHAEVSPPEGAARSPEEEEGLLRYVTDLQTGAVRALERWHPQVPGIRARLVALATEEHRATALRFAAALVLARLLLVEEHVMELHRSAAATAPLVSRLIVATAVAERLPETAAARYATLREAFRAAPEKGGDPTGPLHGLARHDLGAALAAGGGDLAPHLLTEVAAGAAGSERDLAWLTTSARSLLLGWSVDPAPIWKALPPAAPEDATQALLDTERLLLVLLARLGRRAGDVVPVLVTRWQAWRQHPVGAGPCVRTEIALAAIRGAWREPLATTLAMLEGRGSQGALAFTVAASQVPELPIDETLAPAFERGLATGDEQREHLLFFLAAEARRVTPETRVMLARAISLHALPAAEPAVRKQALQALLRLGASLPAEGCPSAAR